VRSSFALLVAILAGFGLAACGGGGSSTDEGPTAEEEVKAAAVRAVENGDAASFCRQEASKGYIAAIYGGDLKKCAGSKGTVAENPSTARAGTAKLKPDHRSATVTVSLTGGDFDGTSGAVEMVKEGGDWKVDEFDDDFIRSEFLASIETVDEGAVSTPGMKACFGKQIKAMPAATIRELTYDSDAGNIKGQNKGLLKMAEKCPESALAEYGAHALTDELDITKGDHKPGYVKCLRKEIEFSLEVSGITTELLAEHPSFAAVAALEGIVEGAKKNCGG
jgi:hypothetical protein